MKKLASATDPLWYKDAIIYELHVRAFADSNGDGIGDFPGLLSHLDYLQDLGVTCIWLLPFFPSPLRDDGYDIANYVDVNPSYGTLNDFKAFLDASHRRNMQVMIELVINHTSDQHPWFKAARVAPPGSPAREMYVWSNTDQLYRDARIIFTDTEKSNWTWDETAHAYYWHRFFSHQPDLNFDNPQVVEEVLKAMRFWLDMGVDALRMDAIPYLLERDNTTCENLPETHAVIKAIRAAIDAEYANRLVLAEANQWPADVRPYFGDGDECHMAFHFPLMPRIYMALRQEDRLPITDIMAQTPPIPDTCQWGLFLRNHDELTLEMVTDNERDYMYLAYSADPRMRINVGIRRRLASLVDNNRRRIELLNSLLLSFPGTPIMYYGDEIGMGDNIYLGDRNGVRTPMQWNSDRNAGFSRCDPARLYFPVVMDPIYGYQVVNVEAQLSDQSSLLHWTRNMIALRKLFQVFGRGTLSFLNPANRKILAYIRDMDRGEGSHETVLCVANLSRFAQPVSLDLAAYAGRQPVEMLGYVPFPQIEESAYVLSLAPYSFLWLELQPATAQPPELNLSTAVDATLVDEVGTIGSSLSPEVLSNGWSGLFSGNNRAVVEGHIANWLPHQRWYGAKSRTVQSVSVLNWTEIPAKFHTKSDLDARLAKESLQPALVFVHVDYMDGASDRYQLPLALSRGELEPESVNPSSIIATFVADSPVTLYDAVVREDFRSSLLSLIVQEAAIPLVAGPNRKASLNPKSPNAATSTHLSSPETKGKPDAGKKIALVAPLPITAQPGESTFPPRPDTPQSLPALGDVLQPPELPPIGDPEAEGSRVEARASSTMPKDGLFEMLPSRVGSAEQSNTSILYGDRLILKLFRRLQPGENPDVEIGRFLTEVARFPNIAPLMGEIDTIDAEGETTTVAMLQGLVENQGDGWQWFLDRLQPFFAAIAGLAAPPESPPAGLDDLRPVACKATEYSGDTMLAAALLGRRTAEMHLALATATDNPAFAPEPMTVAELNDDSRRIDRQITSTLEALRVKLSTLKDITADDAALLLSRRIDLFARAHAIASSMPAGLRIRIHGDYHLGQTLRTRGKDETSSAGDFVLLDFEGEPARPLSERRQKQSPLKDVAGMIRSFSYVAYSGLDRYLSHLSSQSAPASVQEDWNAWAALWQNAASSEFLRAYRETISQMPMLLPPPQQAQALLRAYLLEKALYELLYELNNRPEWLRIPLIGLLTL